MNVRKKLATRTTLRVEDKIRLSKYLEDPVSRHGLHTLNELADRCASYIGTDRLNPQLLRKMLSALDIEFPPRRVSAAATSKEVAKLNGMLFELVDFVDQLHERVKALEWPSGEPTPSAFESLRRRSSKDNGSR